MARGCSNSGAGIAVDSILDLQSTNPVQNAIVTAALNNKADTYDLGTLQDTVQSLGETIDQVNESLSNEIAGKQDALDEEQMDAVNSGITSTILNEKMQELAIASQDILTIQGKIPNQATSSNQLADKNFVNSSIATNTANFIGTFNSVEELEEYSGSITNNDYAFVIDDDGSGTTVYNRYKYNGTEWVFEYSLNNSSFTSAQWEAINSGIAAADIDTIYATSNSVDNLDRIIAGLSNAAYSGDYEDLINKPMVEQTYVPNSSSASAISLGALVNAKMLQNLGTGQFSLAVGNYMNTGATGEGSVALGIAAEANNNECTAIGHVASANGGTQGHAIAIGSGANASENSAIQIGTGTNTTAHSLQVESYTLLNTLTGLVPDERISSNIARTSQIPAAVTVDQTYNSSSTNAQSGAAIAGAGFLTNRSQPGYESLGILGYAANYETVAIGYSSSATTGGGIAIGHSATSNGGYSTAIGYHSKALYQGDVAVGPYAESVSPHSSAPSIAIGYSAKANSYSTIQIGHGTNNEDSTVYIGGVKKVDNTYDIDVNYKILDLATGKIPNDRLTLDTAATENSTNPITSGAVYAALGNIEATLDAIIAQNGSNNQQSGNSGNTSETEPGSDGLDQGGSDAL